MMIMANKNDDNANGDGIFENPADNANLCRMVLEDEDSSTQNNTNQRLKQRSGLTEMFAANETLQALTEHPVIRVLPGGKLFSPPAQRQMWGDKQVLPHINWGDLFFDLFYVSAAFNLAGMFKYSLEDGATILYFLGCFGPIMLNWTDKTHYSARFEVPNDALHRLFEVLELCALALTTLNIEPVYRLENSVKYSNMYLFSVGLVLCNLFILFRYIEIGWIWVDGGPEAKANGRKLFVAKIFPTIFYMASAVVALIFRNNGTETSNIPIILCISGFICQDVIYFYQFDIALPDDGTHKDVVVPMNVHYMIHRYGEWTMLILGESILSLVTADTADYPDPSFHLTFFSGIISVVLLQYLHYKSQPLHANDHAISSHKRQGILFIFLTQLYSASLTLVGASYKMLMLEHKKRSDLNNNAKRILLTKLNEDIRMNGGILLPRLAAPDDDANINNSISDQNRKLIALYFCMSLAFAWLFLDLIILTHKGLSASIRRVTTEDRKYTTGPVLFVTIRISLIIFIAAFGFFENDPVRVSLVGLAGILAQVVLRKVGKLIFFPGPHDTASCSLNLQNLGENAVPALG